MQERPRAPPLFLLFIGAADVEWREIPFQGLTSQAILPIRPPHHADRPCQSAFDI